jgi:hypothetical protein
LSRRKFEIGAIFKKSSPGIIAGERNSPTEILLQGISKKSQNYGTLQA